MLRVKRTGKNASVQYVGKLSLSKKDNDSTTVIIEGFANKAVKDRGNDIVTPAAYKNGLENFEKNPVLLFDHNPAIPVGKVTDVKIREDGLFIRAELSNSDDEITKRVRNLVKEGILKTFSIGFDPIEENKDDEGTNIISKLELYEVSIVGIPMNQESTFSVIQKGMAGDPTEARAIALLDELERRVKNIEEKNTKENEEDKDSDKEEDSEKDEKETKVLLEGETGQGAGHAHIAKVESETGAGTASTIVGEHDPHTHEIKDFKVMPGGEDEHTHPLDRGNLKEPEREAPAEESTDKQADEDEPDPDAMTDEEKAIKNLQECVAAKIPILIEEGMEPDQAVAVAIDKCSREGKCGIFTAKQADQNEGEGQPPTTPVKTESTSDDFGNPHLEAAKQTNVMLGAVITELQKLTDQVAQLVPQTQEAADKTEDEEIPEDNPKDEEKADMPEEDDENKESSEDEGSKQLAPGERKDKLKKDDQEELLKLSKKYLEKLNNRLNKLGM